MMPRRDQAGSLPPVEGVAMAEGGDWGGFTFVLMLFFTLTALAGAVWAGRNWHCHTGITLHIGELVDMAANESDDPASGNTPAAPNTCQVCGLDTSSTPLADGVRFKGLDILKLGRIPLRTDIRHMDHWWRKMAGGWRYFDPDKGWLDPVQFPPLDRFDRVMDKYDRNSIDIMDGKLPRRV